MSTVDFCQSALRNHISPPGQGSVKTRIIKAARKLGWSPSRTRDIWYADPRVSVSAEELREIEIEAGITYGREEARELSRAIERADALLAEMEADSNRSLVHALVAVVRILDRTRAERGR